MRKHLLLLSFLFFSFFANAQNLVPNPSFEDTTSCPNFTSQINKAIGWYEVENDVDYFNACCNLPSVHVPNNHYGYRNAATGDAYVGFWCYITPPSAPYNEKFGIKLSDTLKVGKKYEVAFKLSSVSSHPMVCNGANNKIGILFSTFKYDLTHLPPTKNYTQFHTDSIVTDTTGWALIKGNFIADSAYSYISIGIFYDNAHIDTLRYWYLGTSPGMVTYYFIDDIYIGADTSSNVGYGNINENSFTIYPNPTSNVVNVNTNNNPIESLELFNELGIKEKEVFHPPVSAILKIDITDLTTGLYLLKIKTFNSTSTKKINIISNK